MRFDELVYNTDIKLVFDNDCLASFIWIKLIDILINLYMDNYTACNNLRDIRPFIDNNEINNLLTFDILFEYYQKNNKSIDEIERVIAMMLSKKRKLLLK